MSLAVVLVVAVAVVLGAGCSDRAPSEASGHADEQSAPESSDEEPEYGVEIHSARNLGELDVETGAPAPYDEAGIECGTCHDTWVQGPQAETPAELDEFHRQMTLDHGELTCSSCHHPDDRDKLRLANGQSLAFADTIELCGQCHGPQLRDYRHGSHGGMTGHWDLDQGPRVRNHCVNCHDPHAPAYPKMQPAPAPRDRGLQMMQGSGH